jgi:hypothetical protein
MVFYQVGWCQKCKGYSTILSLWCIQISSILKAELRPDFESDFGESIEKSTVFFLFFCLPVLTFVLQESVQRFYKKTKNKVGF